MNIGFWYSCFLSLSRLHHGTKEALLPLWEQPWATTEGGVLLARSCPTRQPPVPEQDGGGVATIDLLWNTFAPPGRTPLPFPVPLDGIRSPPPAHPPAVCTWTRSFRRSSIIHGVDRVQTLLGSGSQTIWALLAVTHCCHCGIQYKLCSVWSSTRWKRFSKKYRGGRPFELGGRMLNLQCDTCCLRTVAEISNRQQVFWSWGALLHHWGFRKVFWEVRLDDVSALGRKAHLSRPSEDPTKADCQWLFPQFH